MRVKLAIAGAFALAVLSTSTHARAEHRETRMKKPAFVAGGTGLVLFGLAAGAGGAFFTAFAVSCRECFSPPQAGLFAIAGGFDLLSLAGLGTGIAMITIGARRVPAFETAGDTSAPRACAVTSECDASEHCIDGVCRNLDAPQSDERPRPATVSGAVMLGDGHGYVPAAIVTDVCAFLTTMPPWMIAYAADASRFGVGFQAAAFVQLLAGPALHLFEGRIGPALISLLGWSTVAMTTFFVPTVVSPNGDRPNGLAAGTAMLAGGGIAMTVVDALMARPARPSEVTPRATWAPTFRFLPGGAMGGLAGTF